MKKLIPLLTLLLLLLAGCGAKETTAVCLVLGAHANAPAVNVMQFYQDVYDVCYGYGSFSAISVSGQSKVAANYGVRAP